MGYIQRQGRLEPARTASQMIDPFGRTITYLTRCDGACCDCPGFRTRQACSHAVACKMEAERARERATRKPLDVYRELISRHLDDRTGTVSAF